MKRSPIESNRSAPTPSSTNGSRERCSPHCEGPLERAARSTDAADWRTRFDSRNWNAALARAGTRVLRSADLALAGALDQKFSLEATAIAKERPTRARSSS